MTYQTALDYIASLAPRGWRLGLDRMREFAHRADLDDALGPERPRFIHVAGTNGKGSTTAYLQSILHESGYRTGAFFSPYVYDPRERIQLGRVLIPKKIFAGLTAMLHPIAEEFTDSEYGGISEFEFKAAMAFLFYKRLQCEWVALEVGLGGRLDATNIVLPACSVLVSVGLDHTNVLGHSIEEIAREKAGIIKPGVPVIIGQSPEPALRIFEQEAREKECVAWRFGKEIVVCDDPSDGSIAVSTPAGRHSGLALGIPGAMQSHNMALAVAACDASGATRTLRGLQDGTAQARIPARFEIRTVNGRTVVLDGAHNADAAHVLVDTLKGFLTQGRVLGSAIQGHVRPPTAKAILVTGMVAGHDPVAFYRNFDGIVDRAYSVPIDFHRATPPNEVAAILREFVPEVWIMDREAALADALATATEDDVILITGSFYLIGEMDRSFPSPD